MCCLVQLPSVFLVAFGVVLILTGVPASESPAVDRTVSCSGSVNIFEESRLDPTPYSSLMCHYVLQRCHANLSSGLTVRYYRARLLSGKACCLAGGRCWQVPAPAIESSLTLSTSTADNQITSLGAMTWTQARRPVGWACLLFKGGLIDKIMKNETTSAPSYNTCGDQWIFQATWVLEQWTSYDCILGNNRHVMGRQVINIMMKRWQRYIVYS